MEIKKYKLDGSENGVVSLPEELFAKECKGADIVIYEVVKAYLANQRQGTSSVKSRSEVKGSGKKLFRQKGTGNARPGDIKTPVRRGGGRAFGPKPRDWSIKVPKKLKRLALKLALSDLVKKEGLKVIEDLKFATPSTKKAEAIIKSIGTGRKKLIIFDSSDSSLVKSFANIADVSTDRADTLYAYQVLNADNLLITESGLKKVIEVFGS